MRSVCHEQPRGTIASSEHIYVVLVPPRFVSGLRCDLCLNMHPDSFYRVRLVKDFIRIVVAPCITLSLLLRITEAHLRPWGVLVYIIFIVTWGYARLQYTDWMQQREARRMGARPIPRVRGRWPGNLDIYLRLLKAYDTTYVGSFHLRLFEEYQTTTLNLRLLWQDFVSPIQDRIRLPSISPMSRVVLTIAIDSYHGREAYAVRIGHRLPALLERCQAEGAHVSKNIRSIAGVTQSSFREEFLGAGIFNRDDQDWKTVSKAENLTTAEVD